MKAQRRVAATRHPKSKTLVRGIVLRRLAFVSALAVAAICRSHEVAAKAGELAGPPANPAVANPLDAVPVIEEFAISQNSDGAWIVSGIVVDDDLSDVTVQIGGMVANGTVSPAPDGSFSCEIAVVPGTWNYVVAVAMDPDSEQAWPVDSLFFAN